MILDLIAILFIIILSFCLCMNDKVKTTITNCQFSHIFIGLSVIVFYKLVNYFKLKDNNTIFNNNTNNNNNNTTKEHFDTSITQDINDFITGINVELPSTNQVSNLNADQINAYTTQLNNLTTQLNQLQNTLASPKPASISTDISNMQNVDIAAQQQYQQFQIDYLNKQIANAQNVINAQSVANTSNNYKPIKVFSSCIISNADGTTTVEKPVSNPVAKLPPSSSAFTNLINNAISQSNSQTKGPMLNLSQTNESMSNMFAPETGKLGEIFTQYVKLE